MRTVYVHVPGPYPEDKDVAAGTATNGQNSESAVSLKDMIWKTEKVNMPFEVKDCTLITRMGGVPTAVNLRDLREGVAVCPVECLFHHFCETAIRPSFDDPEFRNDFAVWSARYLRDRVLGERLGVINPYSCKSLGHLRDSVLDVLDERLMEVGYSHYAPAGEDFRFMRAVTVVFDSGVELATPADWIAHLPELSFSSVYYHFIEARRRTPDRLDDFSTWLLGFGSGTEELLQALQSIDFYYLTLPELKQALIDVVKRVAVEVGGV